MEVCEVHGVEKTQHRSGRIRCRRCSVEAVTRKRKKMRETLIAEAGGSCKLCGYDQYTGALHFHHLDPATKEFGLSGKGQTYSMERMRREAAKCVLLCANCHAEVEAGLRSFSAG